MPPDPTLNPGEKGLNSPFPTLNPGRKGLILPDPSLNPGDKGLKSPDILFLLKTEVPNLPVTLCKENPAPD